jgi:hypothetical protein
MSLAIRRMTVEDVPLCRKFFSSHLLDGATPPLDYNVWRSTFTL